MAQPATVFLPLAVAGAVAIRVIFWLYTQRRYEDALITITHAVNAVNGLGLTHHPGEGHVHGFTSAVSVLVPLAGEALHSGWGWLAIRLASLVAAAATIWLADRFAVGQGLGGPGRVLVAAYLAFDYLQIFFGMAGMETQIAVALLLLAAVTAAEQRLVVTGLALGLGVLARPDFLIWALAVLVVMVANKPTRRGSARVAIVSLLVVLPWLVFTIAYYGSPVPQTILAKSLSESAPLPSPLNGIGAWLHAVRVNAGYEIHQVNLLAPFGESYFIDPGLWKLVGWLVLALAAAGAWVKRRSASVAPLTAFVLLYVGYLVYFAPPLYYTWYLVPVTAAVVTLAAFGLDAILAGTPRLAVAASVALALSYAIQIPVLFPMERTIQHKIEERVRQPLGMYLQRAVPPGESVGSESAGYIGYYGHVLLYDYPGLTSPTVTDALSQLPPTRRSFAETLFKLHPNWIVLRPNELAGVNALATNFDARYRLVRRFSVSEASSRLERFGITMANFDRTFLVFRRRAA